MMIHFVIRNTIHLRNQSWVMLICGLYRTHYAANMTAQDVFFFMLPSCPSLFMTPQLWMWSGIIRLTKSDFFSSEPFGKDKSPHTHSVFDLGLCADAAGWHHRNAPINAIPVKEALRLRLCVIEECVHRDAAQRADYRCKDKHGAYIAQKRHCFD